MKKIIILFLLSHTCALFAQVGIGDNVTTFNDSEVLKIVSNNKGLLIPNIDIQNLSSPSPLNITVENSSENESMLVYNTNTTTGKGFYVWRPGGWSALLNSTNAFKYLGVINSSTKKSTGAVEINTESGAVSYPIDSAPNNDWKLIPNLSEVINIYSPNNNVTINVTGIVQGTNNSNNTVNSYAIAIVVNDRIKTVRNFILRMPTTCTFNDFNVLSTLKNLPVGSNTIKVYAIYRAQAVSSIGSSTLAFGGKRSNCTNLNQDMASTILNIQISEKP